MIKFLEFIARLGNAILNAINKHKAKSAADNPADTIANGGGVQQSEKSFSDLAKQSKRDSAE